MTFKSIVMALIEAAPMRMMTAYLRTASFGSPAMTGVRRSAEERPLLSGTAFSRAAVTART